MQQEPHPESGDHLIVTGGWVLLSRPRSNNYLFEDLKWLQAKLADGCAIPAGPEALVTAPSDQPVEYRDSPFSRHLRPRRERDRKARRTVIPASIQRGTGNDHSKARTVSRRDRARASWDRQDTHDRQYRQSLSRHWASNKRSTSTPLFDSGVTQRSCCAVALSVVMRGASRGASETSCFCRWWSTRQVARRSPEISSISGSTLRRHERGTECTRSVGEVGRPLGEGSEVDASGSLRQTDGDR